MTVTFNLLLTAVQFAIDVDHQPLKSVNVYTIQRQGSSYAVC